MTDDAARAVLDSDGEPVGLAVKGVNADKATGDKASGAAQAESNVLAKHMLDWQTGRGEERVKSGAGGEGEIRSWET